MVSWFSYFQSYLGPKAPAYEAIDSLSKEQYELLPVYPPPSYQSPTNGQPPSTPQQPQPLFDDPESLQPVRQKTKKKNWKEKFSCFFVWVYFIYSLIFLAHLFPSTKLSGLALYEKEGGTTWHESVITVIDTLERVTEGSTNNVKDLIPEGWPANDTVYQLFPFGMCKESSNHKECKLGKGQYFMVIDDIGAELAEVINVDDKEAFIEGWKNGFRSAYKAALKKLALACPSDESSENFKCYNITAKDAQILKLLDSQNFVPFAFGIVFLMALVASVMSMVINDWYTGCPAVVLGLAVSSDVRPIFHWVSISLVVTSWALVFYVVYMVVPQIEEQQLSLVAR
ncbi:hypothetical protein CXQ85_004912 [Candidozyma haemuli]|uniref:Uncharacterized protein n=1 Tax=Candidozyma haemuli TaxID=45357 RepID=A0A2V1AVV3_9ASCO|nr:hypothetical protein CXQ85_004912 [[Candida] haemuloni]PVH22240.1 hypothetical protein CXQ85_004912 [[Candida] haemuloni]